MQRIHFLIIFCLLSLGVFGQNSPMMLSLDQCRQLALQNNKKLQIATAKEREAYYEAKAAFTKYLPRVDATAAYMRTGREIQLLSQDQRQALSSVGTLIGSVLPQYAPLAPKLDAIGGSVADAFRTDTRNMGALGVMLTQPLYMGGKIRTYNKITGMAHQIAQQGQDLAQQEVLIEVDEAYWRIVELEAKRELAQSYYQLVDTLHANVQKMIAEGFATRADGLSVAVKVNEAQVSLIQVENGLSLSQMLLCQICGLPIDTQLILADNGVEAPAASTLQADVAHALAFRPELRSLRLLTDINKQKVALARSEFLPSVALTGGYMATTPSVFNSFENKLKGTWAVGVMAKIPIITCGERFYKTRAARYQAKQAELQYQETAEKIELQVNQCQQKLAEAEQRQQKAAASREQADENLRYARLGLAEGVIPLSNVLEAQTAWVAAHAEAITANIDYRLAVAYLQKATSNYN